MSASRPVVVGTGIAGLWTAWRLASEGHEVVLLTKERLADSVSAWAQGGIAAALDPDDSPSQHAADTIAASDGLADPEAVQILTREGPDRVYELLALGAAFDRWPDGRLRFGLEAGHSRARIVHAGGDRTGAALIGCLAGLARHHPRIEILETTEARGLLCANGRVIGVSALTRPVGPGEAARAESIPAPAVVLATGGVGQLYEITTNPGMATGDGWALAYHAGAALSDLEFLQFHPTALKVPGASPAPLVSEAVRGAGAILVDHAGRRFALDADPRGELAPRDIVAAAVAAADIHGGAWLDARGIDDFASQFPGITGILAAHGLDPRRDLLPVAPALHYAMGGIQTDLHGRSTVSGLWAVGEVARTGVHGANRLASNSLLEALVFADRAGRQLAAQLKEAVIPGASGDSMSEGLDIISPDDHGADAACETMRARMRRLMTANVGLQRTETSLAEAETALADLAAAAPAEAWRTRHQLLTARLITQAARQRRESRGAHHRLDFPPAAPLRAKAV